MIAAVQFFFIFFFLPDSDKLSLPKLNVYLCGKAGLDNDKKKKIMSFYLSEVNTSFFEFRLTHCFHKGKLMLFQNLKGKQCRSR